MRGSTMPPYVAFLRGINLGRRRLRVDRLAALVGDVGFDLRKLAAKLP